MEQGLVDLCFATAATPLPPGAVSEPLASDRLALVMRRGHPAANRTWSLADYALYPHATVAFFGDGVSEIDAALAAAGVERRIALTTPHFMATIAAVAASDCVTTISKAFARRFAEPLGLVLRPPPLPDALDVTMVGLAFAPPTGRCNGFAACCARRRRPSTGRTASCRRGRRVDREQRLGALPSALTMPPVPYSSSFRGDVCRIISTGCPLKIFPAAGTARPTCGLRSRGPDGGPETRELRALGFARLLPQAR